MIYKPKNKKPVLIIIAIILFWLAAGQTQGALNDSLEAYYSFDYATLTDDTSNTYDWSCYNTDNATSGLLGQSYLFDSTTDRCELTDSYSIENGNFSISVWVNTSDNVSTNRILQFTNNKDIWLGLESGAGLKFQFFDGISVYYANYNIPANVWLHIAATRSKTAGLKLYINGVQLSNNTFTGDASNHGNNKYYLGNIDASDTRRWAGNIDELAIFSRELVQDDITTLYNSGVPCNLITNPTCTGGGSPPAASGLRNVTFTANTNFNASSIDSFNITVNGGGTNGTTTGSIILELNITNLFNITFHSPTHIINDTYLNVNLSTDLTGWLHQAEYYFTASDYVRGTTLNTFNTTLDDSFNQTTTGTTKHFLTAGNYSVTGEHSQYYSIDSLDVEAQALSNNTGAVKFYKALNLTVVSVTGAPINNFSANIRGLELADSRTNSTNDGHILYYVTNQTYNITVNATGYAQTLNSRLIQINDSNGFSEIEITLYTTNSFDIEFIDESSSERINGTQIFLDLISDLYAANYSTTNGTMYIDLLTPTTYTFRYFAAGYQPRLSTYTLQNNTYNQITLYLLIGGSNVSLFVYDTARQPVENSTINIFRYSTANNSYLQINTLNTDFEGKAVTDLELSSEFYRFYIYYNNELKLSTSPAYITGTEIVFTINRETSILSEYYDVYNDYTYSLTYSPSTQNFKYYYDSSGEASQGCLYVYKITSTGETLHNSSCLAAGTGTILLAGQNVSGTNYLTKAYITTGGETYLVKQLGYTWAETYFTTTSADYGLFIVLLMVILFAFIGIWSLPVALVFSSIPLLIGSIAGLINVPIGAATGVLIISIILAGVVSRR